MKALMISAALLLGSLAAAQTSTPTTPPSAQPAAAPAASGTPTSDTSTSGTSTSDTSSGGTSVSTATPQADPSTVVAQVGSQTITLGDFEAQFKALVARALAAQGMAYSDDVLSAFAPYRADFLNQLVRRNAVLQLAAKAGIQADPAQIDQRVADSRAEFDSDAAFQEALTGAGFADEAAYRQALIDSQVYNAYLDSLKGRFTFGDAVVAGYYAASKQKLARDPEACAKHILVADEATAKKVADQLAAGGDFAALAKQYSQDPGSKDQGGDLGCLAPGDTVAEFDKAVFTGPLNTVQTVKTQYGYHLIVVTKRTAGGVPSLADAAPTIRDTLAADAAQKYLDAQVKKLGVQVYPDRVTVPAPGK